MNPDEEQGADDDNTQRYTEAEKKDGREKMECREGEQREDEGDENNERGERRKGCVAWIN